MLRFVQTLIMWHEQPIKVKITTLTALSLSTGNAVIKHVGFSSILFFFLYF